jgi:hypothetical protein
MIFNPLIATIDRSDGYAVFGFVWFNDNRVLWADGDPAVVSFGPAYTALKDGWRDALLIDYAVRTRGVITMNEVASTSGNSLLPLSVRPAYGDASETQLEFTHLTQQSLNSARRELLQRLTP